MVILSEPETIFHDQLAEVLEALPALRRWLQESLPARQSNGQQGAPPSITQVRAVIHLRQNGPQTMGELARGLGIACSTATECVDALVARGRVLRERSQRDSRRVIVRLTPEAEAMVALVQSHRQAIAEIVLLQLSSRERNAFVKGLRLFSSYAEDALEQARANPSAFARGPAVVV